MATHPHIYLGGDGKSYGVLTCGRLIYGGLMHGGLIYGGLTFGRLIYGRVINRRMSTHSHIHLGGDDHSYPYLSRRRCPPTPISI